MRHTTTDAAFPAKVRLVACYSDILDNAYFIVVSSRTLKNNIDVSMSGSSTCPLIRWREERGEQRERVVSTEN